MIIFRKRYRRRLRKLPIRVVTLPKSGTNFYIDLFRKLGLHSAAVTHIVGYEDKLELEPGENAIMTVRDPRAFFSSLAKWCDVVAQRLVNGENVPPEYIGDMYPDLAPVWLAMSFEEKVYAGATLQKGVFYEMDRIKAHFDGVNTFLEWGCVETYRFEDIMAWGTSGPTEKQVSLISSMIRKFGMRMSDKEIASAMRDIRGTSKTFVSGVPGKWERELNDELRTLIEDRWGSYIDRWGYTMGTV